MTKIAKHDQTYNRLQIVARFGDAGVFKLDGKRYRIWRFMTFYAGPGKAGVAAEFIGMAPRDDKGFLRIEAVPPGHIVVTPGLLYKNIPMSGIIHAEHMKKMKRFRPRDVVETYKDTAAGAVDLGVIDLRTKH